MKRRTLAILMALSLLISIVPLTAMAAECEHENVGYVPTTPGYHDMKCMDCGYMYEFVFTCKGADMDYNGICDKCGYQYKCNHEGGAWVSNNDGTHSSSCDCGENTVSGECQYIDGKCYMCGYVFPAEPVCNHEGGAWVSNNDGTHSSSCDCGENTVSGECQYIDGKCYMCGYRVPAESHECDFAAGVTSNEDGTHNINCSCGEHVTVKCLDNDGDAECDSCGYVKYCKHEWQGVVNKGTTHDIVCRDCSAVLKANAEHEYNEYDTCACGAVKSHKCTFEAGVTSNEDGTHNINCECGEYVTVKCLDPNGDGKCDSCGYELYPAVNENPEETKPEESDPAVTDPEETKPEESDPAVTEPEETDSEVTEPTTAATEEEDEASEAPQTGDNTPVAVLIAVMLLAVAAMIGLLGVKLHNKAIRR